MELYDFFSGKGDNYENQINSLLFRFLLKHEYNASNLIVPFVDDINLDGTEICGKGIYGTVYKKEGVCVKQFDKAHLKEGAKCVKDLNNEIEILKLFRDSEYTISFIDLLQTDKAYYIVTDFGGIPLSRLMHGEQEIEFYLKLTLIKQIANAVSYIHEQGIAHCDIKPSNILISDGGLVKLCDFGFSVMVGKTKKITMCGTSGFYSPQMYDPRVNLNLYKNDSWSVGVTFLYILSTDKQIFRVWVAMYELHKLKEENTTHILSEFVDNVIMKYMNDGINYAYFVVKCTIELLIFSQEQRQHIHTLNKKIQTINEYNYTIQFVSKEVTESCINELVFTYLIPKKSNSIVPVVF